MEHRVNPGAALTNIRKGGQDLKIFTWHKRQHLDWLQRRLPTTYPAPVHVCHSRQAMRCMVSHSEPRLHLGLPWSNRMWQKKCSATSENDLKRPCRFPFRCLGYWLLFKEAQLSLEDESLQRERRKPRRLPAISATSSWTFRQTQCRAEVSG